MRKRYYWNEKKHKWVRHLDKKVVNAPAVHVFKEQFFEHLGPAGTHCTSKKEKKMAMSFHGVTDGSHRD